MAKISSLLRRNRPTRTRPYNPEVLFRDNWRDYDFENKNCLTKFMEELKNVLLSQTSCLKIL